MRVGDVAWLTLLSLLLPASDQGEMPFLEAGYAQERCCNVGCISRVKPDKGELVAKIVNRRQVASVYFEPGSALVKKPYKALLEGFIDKYTINNPAVTIVGYADGCGTVNQNKLLSARRATSVEKEFKKNNKVSIIDRKAAGEISEGHDPLSRRVDVTLSSNVTLYEPPPSLVADVYLIDASISMRGELWQRWKRSIEYHRPDNSLVYVSTTRCIAYGTRLSNVIPYGGTEIWFSYWTVLDFMKPGQTLAIISDFESNIKLTGVEYKRLKQKAKSKRVRVIVVSL
jgi:hypothetical protein|tara:strand:- start:443 stop:1297 length:855 start_codon:yes stop_codon:yes gene_type:complete